MRYLTVVESLRAEGNRHAARAAAYRADGKQDYAEGSMRKAQRKWDRAKWVEEAIRVSLTPNLRAIDAL